jgi:PH/SEC7 domain-containing protein
MISVAGGGYDRRALRSPSDRVNVLKRGSIRGVQGLMSNGSYQYSTSSDGRLSPTPSYANSISENTLSFSQPSIGFASNLSHTIVREDGRRSAERDREEVRSKASASVTGLSISESISSAEEMSDDDLALLGAPWAKEGLVWRRAGVNSDLNNGSGVKKIGGGVGGGNKRGEWKQFFAVISKGEFYIFTFGSGRSVPFGGAVGGGNWLVSKVKL